MSVVDKFNKNEISGCKPCDHEWVEWEVLEDPICRKCGMCTSEKQLKECINEQGLEEFTNSSTESERIKWISVKENLPKTEDEVLVFVKGYGQVVTWHYMSDENSSCWHLEDLDYKIHNWDELVTHWMPLPEPPKGCEND